MMKNSFTSLIYFNEYSILESVHDKKYATMTIAEKKNSPNTKYIFKKFKFNCNSPKQQKIITETFSHISKLKNQYLQCYKKYSYLSFDSKFNTTFSIKYISKETLEKVIKNPDFAIKWTITDIFNCLFAVAQGMLFLHDHLICHGNLNPSNIIIDACKQCYLIDFGLYPIKKLYMNPAKMFNKEYSDPNINNFPPTMNGDIYSYGILTYKLFLSFFQRKESLPNNSPPIISKIIQNCKKSSCTFRQIIEMFQDESYLIENTGKYVRNLYSSFIGKNYIEQLANFNDDSNASNRIGQLYFNGQLEDDERHTKALFYFEKSAKLNNSKGQNNYGVLLQKISNLNEKAASYLKKSAQQGNVYGMANYGIALMNGNGVRKNLEMAEMYLKKSALLGCAYAQVNYGIALISNHADDETRKRGMQYIRMSISQGCAEAYYAYSVLLKSGTIIEKDEKMSNNYLKIAADLGYERAMNELAVIAQTEGRSDKDTHEMQAQKESEENNDNSHKDKCEKNMIDRLTQIDKTEDHSHKDESDKDTLKMPVQIESDETEDSSHKDESDKDTLKKSAETESDEKDDNSHKDKCEKNTIEMLTQTKSEEKGSHVETLETSTENEDASDNAVQSCSEINYMDEETPTETMYSLFKQCKDEYCSYKESGKKRQSSFRLFQHEDEFASSSDARIIYKLAKFYRDNEELDKSREKSTRYYKMSADLGYAKAQAIYGLCLQRGDGTEADEKLGLQYLKKAAEQGSLLGMNSYGASLYKGVGTDKDAENGLMILKKAADLGCAESQFLYGKWNDDPVTGHLYIEKAVENHHEGALFKYGRDFMEGRGVGKDMEKAAEVFAKLYEKEGKKRVLLKLIKCLKQTDSSMTLHYLKMLADSDSERIIDKIHEAQFEYALELLKGERVEQDVDLAVDYFIKSGKIDEIRQKHPEIYQVIQKSAALDEADNLDTSSDELLAEKRNEIASCAFSDFSFDSLLDSDTFYGSEDIENNWNENKLNVVSFDKEKHSKYSDVNKIHIRELERANKIIAEYEHEKNESQKFIEEQKKQIRELKAKIEQIKENENTLNIMHEDEREKSKNHFDEQEKQIRELKNQIIDMKEHESTILKKHKNETKTSRNYIKEQEKQIEELENQIIDMKEHENTILRKHKDENKTSKKHIEGQEKQIRELENQIINMKEHENTILSDFEDEKEENKILIEKQKKRIRELESQVRQMKEHEDSLIVQHDEERRYDRLQIDNQKQTIKKLEAKIRRYEDNLLTAYITVRVQPDQTIRGTIRVREHGAAMDRYESRYLLNTDSNSPLGLDAYKFESRIKTLNQKVSFTEKAGTYYLHVLLIDNYGNKKEMISQELTIDDLTDLN